MKKLTQSQIAFLLLWQACENYIPVFSFIGEVIILETSKLKTQHLFLSYKGTTRASELYFEIEGMKRKKITGRSGAKYYAYMLPHSKFDNLPEKYKTLI